MRILITLIVLLLSAGAVLADNAPQWPPDPEEVFANGVLWESVKPLTRAVWANYQERLIRVYFADEDRVETFDFPDDDRYFYSLTLQSDNNVRVVLQSSQDYVFGYYRNDLNPQDVLLLNTLTGLYESVPTVCDGLVAQSPSEMDGEWHVTFRDNDYQEPVLCHTKTGEMREIEPQGLGRSPTTAYPASPRAFVSPDDQAIVLVGHHPTESGSIIYAYHLQDGTWITLGEYSSDSALTVCGWVSDTEGLLCSGNSISGHATRTSYIRFDTKQSQSLESIFSAWGPETLIRTDFPSRYIVFASDSYAAGLGGGLSSQPSPCIVTFYDERWLERMEVGYECIPTVRDVMHSNTSLFLQQDEHVYFLTIAEQESTVSTLQYINLLSPAPMIYALFTAEIERIVSVSPDGSYVVVLMDDDGVLEFHTQSDISRLIGPQWRITILESEYGGIIYQSEPIGVDRQDQLGWLDDRTLIVVAHQLYTPTRADDDGDYYVTLIPSSIRRITLHDDSQDIVIRQGNQVVQSSDFGWSPSRRYLYEDGVVLDLLRFEYVAIFQEEIHRTYQLSVNWEEGHDQLLVWMNIPGARELVRYRVTLPD